MERLSHSELSRLTHGYDGGIFNGPQFARRYVYDSEHGVPFLSSSSMLHADFAHVDLLKRSEATSARLAHLRIDEGTTLVSCSGTIGRMVYVRPEMSGAWSSQDAIKIVPDPDLVRPGYLYAFLRGAYGRPMLTGGTYGAIVQHVEPQHIARIPVPLARISHSSSRSGLMRRGWGSGRPYRTPAVVWMWATTCAWRQNRPGKHTTRERTPCPPAVVNVCRHLADRQAGSGGERKR